MFHIDFTFESHSKYHYITSVSTIQYIVNSKYPGKLWLEILGQYFDAYIFILQVLHFYIISQFNIKTCMSHTISEVSLFYTIIPEGEGEAQRQRPEC